MGKIKLSIIFGMFFFLRVVTALTTGTSGEIGLDLNVDVPINYSGLIVNLSTNYSSYANCWLTTEGIKCDVSDITYDEISGGDVNALGYTGTFNFLEGVVGRLSIDGDPWYLAGTDLQIAEDLYIDGFTYFGNHSYPQVSNVYDIGSGAKRFRNLYIGNVSSDYLDATYGISTLGNVTASFYNGINLSDLNTSSNTWTRTGTNLHPINIGDNVGIGLTNPASLLSLNASAGDFSYSNGDGNFLNISKINALGTSYMYLEGLSLASVSPTKGVGISDGILMVSQTQNPIITFVSNESDGFATSSNMLFNLTENYLHFNDAGLYTFDSSLVVSGVGLIPAIVFDVDDLDTGFGTAGENKIGFIAGGKALYIANGTSGNTAIGFTSTSYNPQSKLDINGTTNIIGDLNVTNTSPNQAQIGYNGTSYLNFNIGDEGETTITAIGTNPEFIMQAGVAGGFTFSSNNGDYKTLLRDGEFRPYVIDDNTIKLGDTDSRWKSLRVGTDDSSFDGKVGIGTATPQNTLNVVGDLNVTENITLGNKLTFGFGEYIHNLVDGVLTFIVDKVQINGDLNVTGNFTGNLIYGEIWYHNHTGTNLDFSVTKTFYPVFYTDDGEVNGFSYDIGFGQSSNITAEVSGLYSANYRMIGTGDNNHIYITTILVNGADYNDKCHDHKTLAAGGDQVPMGNSCFVRLNIGDNVTTAVQDYTGTSSGDYFGANLKLVRIGD